MDSKEEYVIAHRKKVERRQRVLTMALILPFLGSGVLAVIPTLQQNVPNSKQASATVSAESSLQQQAKGFELVLQREPENLVALEGLVNIRIRLKDFRGATPPLEKLVKLHPERPEYKALLEQVKIVQDKGKGER